MISTCLKPTFLEMKSSEALFSVDMWQNVISEMSEICIIRTGAWAKQLLMDSTEKSFEDMMATC